MKDLPFNVEGQLLTKGDAESFMNIVAGSDNYLCCRFHFDEQWSRCSKYIEFLNKDGSSFFKVVNDAAAIPKSVTPYSFFKLRLHCVRDGNPLFSTNYVLVEQKGGANG